MSCNHPENLAPTTPMSDDWELNTNYNDVGEYDNQDQDVDWDQLLYLPRLEKHFKSIRMELKPLLESGG